MNHMQKYGFKDFKLCDTHIHLVFPETLESTEKAFREKIRDSSKTVVHVSNMHDCLFSYSSYSDA